MKLKSFRIKNYKSIIDSGECRLSDNDNITTLAGQNESGKSSILQALRDFGDFEIDLNCLRNDDSLPEITCTYSIEEKDIALDLDFKEGLFPESFKKIIKNIKELIITKLFDIEGTCTFHLSEDLILIFNELLIKENEKVSHEELMFDIDKTIDEITTSLTNCTPEIMFFDDFCDLLPDQISIADIIANNPKTLGIQAVKNIQEILKTDFVRLDKITDSKRETEQNIYHETISAKFNEKWKQRICDGNGAKIHVKYYQGQAIGASYLKFYIETTKGELLEAEKRSQGFKWFLSFFLHLKAQDVNEKKLIILFDEPGLYLHSKAQSDMIAVFEELAIKNQIIYSTHSPYLIDTTKLNRLKLILNTKKHGTTIEKITSVKINNQKDALKPIIDALGLEVASPFSVAIKDNVILEGISDFHYFQAMKKILNKNYAIGLLPSMGSSNSHLLMELCIGWQLNWLLIFDDKGATKDYNKIKKNFFNDVEEDADKKMYKIKGCDGIEDIFTVGDMKLVNSDAAFSTERKNSDVVSQYGGKELYARLFHEKVMQGHITKGNISKTAIKKFEEIFSFIENGFDIH